MIDAQNTLLNHTLNFKRGLEQILVFSDPGLAGS